MKNARLKFLVLDSMELELWIEVGGERVTKIYRLSREGIKELILIIEALRKVLEDEDKYVASRDDRASK